MRVLAELAAWWAITFTVWVATLQTVTVAEVAVGAVCALACSIPARMVRHANDGVWQPKFAWLRWVPVMVLSLARDTLGAWRYALRVISPGPGAELVRLGLPAESPAVAAARRAIGVLVLGATPATVVVDDDPDRDELLLHRLGGGRTALDSRVGR